MGNITTKNLRSAIAFYDPDACDGNRLYDAIGPSIVKYLNEFSHMPVDDTTHDPSSWTNTIVEEGADSTAVVTDIARGALLITCAGNDNDGYNMQLGHGHGGAGENVAFDGPYPTYFGIKFKINDVDQTDHAFGLCITDTSAATAVSDGMYFRSVDESAVLYFVAEKDSLETVSAVATMADDTWITAEFYYDGTDVMAYIDGNLEVTVSNSDANFPNDELLRLTIALLSGEATANTCTIDWVRLIHIRG